MAYKKNTVVAGKTLSKPNARTGKTLATSVLTQRSQSKACTVVARSAKSGKVISRAVMTHRDALKRLANR